MGALHFHFALGPKIVVLLAELILPRGSPSLLFLRSVLGPPFCWAFPRLLGAPDRACLQPLTAYWEA